MVSGELLVASTKYSVAPILAVPDGSTRFWVLTALTTSFGVALRQQRAGVEVHRYHPLFAAVGPGIATPGIEAPVAPTVADGVACRVPNDEALSVILRGVERVVRVREEQIRAAMRIYYSATHNLAEGAGALALAAVLAGPARRHGVWLSYCPAPMSIGRCSTRCSRQMSATRMRWLPPDGRPLGKRRRTSASLVMITGSGRVRVRATGLRTVAAGGAQIQSRRSRDLEFRGRASQRKDHQGAHPRLRLQGHTHHASHDDPQYEIKSDKTEHIAAHKGSALEKAR